MNNATSNEVTRGDEPNNPTSSNTPKAPKDKSCPYCGQAFTSSSLGRHLDLFIKEKNPKPPDGIHDLEAIRKLRGSITRRHPRASLARRANSTPTGTPAASGSRRSPASDDAESSAGRTPVAQKDSARGESITTPRYPFSMPWEATGVINDIPRNGEPTMSGSEAPPDSSRPAVSASQPQRAVSRQMQKAQIDMKHKMQDALDTARAAELALREMMGSWRAAKQFIDMNSMPFDFEPLALDFPALTLQCLQPPPTLFSSLQHSTTTSWSISPPGHQQYEALCAYFKEEFRKWRIICETTTTAVNDDIPYPPPAVVFKYEAREAAERALRMADSLERQVEHHVQSTYATWQGLPAERQGELWVLELARSVGKKQHEIDSLKETQHSLKQDNANLKSHVEHLNRLQQPREFKISHPPTIPVGMDLVSFMLEEAAVNGRRTLGLNLDDRHVDLETLVSRAIHRWKNVIVSTRSTGGGMSAQRPLGEAASTASSQVGSSLAGMNDGNEVNGGNSAQARNQAPQSPQQHGTQAGQDPPESRQQHFGGGPNGRAHTPGTTATAVSVPTTSTPSAPASVINGQDDDVSDQDADAEMEDDENLGYPAMNAAAQPHQSVHSVQPRLEVTSMPARGGAQQQFGVNGNNTTGMGANVPGAIRAGHAIRGGTSHMNAAMPWKQAGFQQQTQPDAGPGHGSVSHADMGMTMHGGAGGEPMYTD